MNMDQQHKRSPRSVSLPREIVPPEHLKDTTYNFDNASEKIVDFRSNIFRFKDRHGIQGQKKAASGPEVVPLSKVDRPHPGFKVDTV